MWRGADDEERAHLSELMGRAPFIGSPDRRTFRSTVARVVVGGVLVIVGLGELVATRHPSLGVLFRTFVAANVVIVGFLIVFGPWWLRLARDLAVERRERRAQRGAGQHGGHRARLGPPDPRAHPARRR